MHVRLLVPALLVLLPMPAAAQTLGQQQQEVWQTVRDCFDAVERKDQAALLDCFHEEYSFWWAEDVLPFGKDLVRRVAPVDMAGLQLVADDVRPARIVVKGDVAIVHWGLRRFTRGEGGVEVSFVERVSMTLLREDGRWRFLGGGGSPLIQNGSLPD